MCCMHHDGDDEGGGCGDTIQTVQQVTGEAVLADWCERSMEL